jgi:serine/threonine protein kinase/tetratricopeptide (TPR) repeat protein
MARTERIEDTKPVTPPRDHRVDRGDTPTVALPDEVTRVRRGGPVAEGGGAPLPKLNTRFGRYVILDVLGQGGMGVVYTAFDNELDRKVALKLLRLDSQPGGEGPTEGRARLVREAKAMAQLAHPNVVIVHDVGQIDGHVFVAMEFVKGHTLRKWVGAAPRTWKDKVGVLVQAGEGLAAAHAAGLVHRDFKPDNILVGEDGRVRVTDFGLARASDTQDIPSTVGPRTGPVAAELTEPGLVMGTPPYMAPEQTAGRRADAKMDQFAFCVTLFEALHGERPFTGKTRQERRDQILAGQRRPWPKGSDVPVWLRETVQRGLAYAPEDRFTSMSDLIDALRRRPWRRRRVAAGLATTAVLGALAASVWPADDLAGRCEGASDHLAGHWDDDRRAGARAALLSTGVSYANDTWDRVEERLDGYSETWVQMRTEACEATARGEQSDQLLDRRMACLDRRLADLGALTQVLGQADTAVVDRAVWATGALPRVEDCADLAYLEAQIGPPRDPAQAHAVANLRAELARAQVLERVAHHADALRIVETAAATAEQLDHAELRADALRLEGALQARTGELSAAEDSLSEAALTAAAHEHDRVAAAAATEMMYLVGTKPGAYNKGLLWGWYAESAVKRLGEGGVEEADMLDGLGEVFLAHGEYEQAKSHFTRAVDLRRDVLGADHPSVARTLRSLGDLHAQAGDLDEARTRYRAALDVSERAFGSLHPEVTGLLETLGRLEAGTHHAALAPALAGEPARG